MFLFSYSILVGKTSLLPVDPVGNSKTLLFRDAAPPDVHPGPQSEPRCAAVITYRLLLCAYLFAGHGIDTMINQMDRCNMN